MGGGEVGTSECAAASALVELTSACVVMSVVFVLLGALLVGSATGECRRSAQGRGAGNGDEAPVQSSSANALREPVGEWSGEKMPPMPPPFASRRADGLAERTVICSSGSASALEAAGGGAGGEAAAAAAATLAVAVAAAEEAGAAEGEAETVAAPPFGAAADADSG